MTDASSCDQLQAECFVIMYRPPYATYGAIYTNKDNNVENHCTTANQNDLLVIWLFYSANQIRDTQDESQSNWNKISTAWSHQTARFLRVKIRWIVAFSRFVMKITPLSPLLKDHR